MVAGGEMAGDDGTEGVAPACAKAAKHQKSNNRPDRALAVTTINLPRVEFEVFTAYSQEIHDSMGTSSALWRISH